MVKESEGPSEDERRALRGSKFAPLSSLPPPRVQPRLAHPGGPLTTNKAAALAKFLERKLQEPDGLASLNPDLIEVAVKNARNTLTASSASNSGRTIRHVTSFDNMEVPSEEEKVVKTKPKEPKKKKKYNKKQKKKQNKKLKVMKGL